VNEHRMLGQIDECVIGGKKARICVYRVYDKDKKLAGPIRYDWNIYIDGEGIVSEGSSERDNQFFVRKDTIDRLRKERRKPRLKTAPL
jgi:hypothetical protein